MNVAQSVTPLSCGKQVGMQDFCHFGEVLDILLCLEQPKRVIQHPLLYVKLGVYGFLSQGKSSSICQGLNPCFACASQATLSGFPLYNKKPRQTNAGFFYSN